MPMSKVIQGAMKTVGAASSLFRQGFRVEGLGFLPVCLPMWSAKIPPWPAAADV